MYKLSSLLILEGTSIIVSLATIQVFTQCSRAEHGQFVSYLFLLVCPSLWRQFILFNRIAHFNDYWYFLATSH